MNDFKRKSETPYIPYGPATGVEQPDNPVTHDNNSGSYYTGDYVPGSHVRVPGTVHSGPGHVDCDECEEKKED